jgi:hypothetical protein
MTFPKDIMGAGRNKAEKLEIAAANSKWASVVPASSIFEYVVMYANFFPSTDRTGNRKKDIKDGIYHLELGKDVGIVKEISLSKENNPYLVSDRLARDGEINRIAHPYHADVKMIGNTYFKPGSRVFINPSMTGLGSATSRNSIVSKLGIGGYYVVLGVSSTIGPGVFETTFRAKYESQSWKTSSSAPTPKSSEKVETKIDAAPNMSGGILMSEPAATGGEETFSRPAPVISSAVSSERGNATSIEVIPMENDADEFDRLVTIYSEYVLRDTAERKELYLTQHGLHSIKLEANYIEIDSSQHPRGKRRYKGPE